MIEKQFDSITKSDIDALVDNKIVERRTLEYKAELPLGTDEAKREFLSDVTSFANSSGGDILYGVSDERDANGQPTGRPREAAGLADVTETSEQLRLESIVRDGVDPRIAGVQIRTIPGFPKGPVILVRVPRSWLAPHMVTYKNVSRFYTRNSAGKYQLDVGEIRSAFALSESVPEKIRAFRTNRLAKILGGEAPVSLGSNQAMILHLFPISAIERLAPTDVCRDAKQFSANLMPLSAKVWSNRFNADGFLIYDDSSWGASNRKAATYIQVFRSGALEVVNQRLLIRTFVEHDKIIPMGAFERQLLTAVEPFIRFQHDLGIALPIVLMLSLTGVKEFALTTGPSDVTDSKIDRDVLIAPDVLIENFDVDPDILLRPVLDFVWQAAGWAESPNYRSDGRWGGGPG
jgi:hypothetical protein